MSAFVNPSRLSSILQQIGFSDVEKEFTNLSKSNENPSIPGFYSSHKAKDDNIASLINSWATVQSIMKVQQKYPTKEDVDSLEREFNKLNSSSSFPSLRVGSSGRSLRYPQYLQLRQTWREDLQPILSTKLFVEIGGNSMNLCNFDALLTHLKTIARCSEHYSYIQEMDLSRTGYVTEQDFKKYVDHFASKFSFLSMDFDQSFIEKYLQFATQQFLVVLDPLCSKKIMIGKLLNEILFMFFVMADGWAEDRPNPFSLDNFKSFVSDFNKMDINNDGIIEGKDLIYMNKLRLTPSFANRAKEGIQFNDNVINFEWYVRFRVAWYSLGETFANSYFFDAIDIDGNGIITQYEINYFVRDVIAIAKECFPNCKSIPPYDFIASQILDMCQATNQQFTRENFVKSRATANLIMRMCDAREFVHYELDEDCPTLQPPIPDVHSL